MPSTSSFNRTVLAETTAQPSPPKRQRTEMPSTSGMTVLAEIGETAQSLTPRKQRLYGEIKRVRKSLHHARRTLSWKKKTAESIPYFKHLTLPAQIFIKSQLETFSDRRKRWSTEEKALFLSIYKTSPKCYRYLRLIFNLPHIRTLQRSLSNIYLKAGLNKCILELLNIMSLNMKDKERYCVLMFDEVSLKPYLELNKNLKGLVNYGDGDKKKISNTALVFMIRGINASWKQPISFYFSQNATPSLILKRLIKDTIRTLHCTTKFKILATVSDQASTNIRAIKLLSGNLSYRYCIDNDEIIHIFDTPHLLKGMRNAFLTKNIIFNGKEAKLDDIKHVYGIDNLTEDGRILSKLTDKHIYPVGREKMKVNLAVQLFSNSVYSLLTFANNSKILNCEGTLHFVKFLDDLFNSLNSTKNSKLLKGPLTDNSPHLTFWVDCIGKLEDLQFVENGVIVKSPPSAMNFIVTIKNVKYLWQKMKKLGFKFLLTRTLNQDPLENYFGQIRSFCGQNTKPTPFQFVSAFKTSLFTNVSIHSQNANCEKDGTDLLFTLSSLIEHTVSPTQEPRQSPPTPAYLQEISYAAFTDLNKLQVTYRNQTGLNICKFIIKKIFSKIQCDECKHFLVTENNAVEHESYVILDDAKVFPTQQFLNIINLIRKQVFHLFFSNFNKQNLVHFLTINISVSIPNFCNIHNLQYFIKKITAIIMTRYIIRIINNKMHKKDTRKHATVDKFLKYYAPKLRE